MDIAPGHISFEFYRQRSSFHLENYVMKPTQIYLFICLLISTVGTAQTPVVTTHGIVISEKLVSKILHENLLGLNETRHVMIYLPPGYATSGKSYPVVYYCHSMLGNAETIIEGTPAIKLLERAFTAGVIKEVIFVVADYSTSAVGSLYENSPVSGRWIDFTTKELVPFIDGKFRTIRHSESRAIVGDFMGGRGALTLAMTHPDIFSVVYAMHPVATGMGYLPWTELGIDWKKILQAKSTTDIADIPRDSRAWIFIPVCQAFLPNPSRPPFYCDFFMDLENGEVKVNVENMLKAKKGFLLEGAVGEFAANLKKLRGIAFDWARYDGNYDHIFSARVFTRELDDLGIEHDAEEYRGNPWNRNWTDDGRFYTRLLPFIARHMVFE